MRNRQSLAALVVLSSLVACATATTSGAPGEDTGAAGANTVGNGGTGPGAAGTGATTAGTSSGGQLAFGGSASTTAGTGNGGAGGSSAGAAGAVSTGGAGASAGGSSGGQAGTSSNGGAGGNGTAGAGTAGSGTAGATGTPGPCMNPMDVTGTNSGNLGAAPDVCLRTMSKFGTVGCSNFDGRNIIVNGTPATCGAAGTYTQIDGYNYIEITSTGSTLTYASVYWF